MRKQKILVFALCLGASLAIGAEWQGRVVDMRGAALAGVKVTLHPQGNAGLTDGNGVYRLFASGSPEGGTSPSTLAGPLKGPGPGFQAGPPSPARDMLGRRLRPDRNRWAFIVPIPPRSETAPPLPLAKGSGASYLTAEKPGFQTMSVSLVPGRSIPDIILAPGRDWSRPVAIVTAPHVVPRLSNFPLGNTSTDLPNVAATFKVAAGNSTDTTFILKFELETDTGVRVFARPHTFVPDIPEMGEITYPDAITYDSGLIDIGMLEKIRPGTGEPGSQDSGPARSWGPNVNLLLRKQAPGQEYGPILWLQFLGPIPAVKRVPQEGAKSDPTRKAAVYFGKVPALETSGRVAGKVVWKDADPLPELWIGMIGTLDFTRIAPDGSFLTEGLPPGNPPLAVMRVLRREPGTFGRVSAHTLYQLDGVTVISGQTTVLESILLAPE